jgi:hypothetical protein
MANKKLSTPQITTRKRPKKEEEGVSPLFLLLDWVSANSTMIGDMGVDTIGVQFDYKKGQKGKGRTPKKKEVPDFFPHYFHSLFGQEMDVLYSVSPAKGHPLERKGVMVWVSGYQFLDPLKRESKYSNAQREKIIRGWYPLVSCNNSSGEPDWDGRIFLFHQAEVRLHQEFAKQFKDVFGVIDL